MFFLKRICPLVQHVSREHQVRNGGLQPVPRNHLAHLRRAVVGELEMRSPGLEVHVKVSVQHRRADASQGHAVKPGLGLTSGMSSSSSSSEEEENCDEEEEECDADGAGEDARMPVYRWRSEDALLGESAPSLPLLAPSS